MLKPEKAIEMLNRLAQTDIFYIDYWQPIQLAIKAIEKDIPRKVASMQDHYIPETYDYEYTSGNCPNCAKAIACDEREEVEFCPRCGQRLDWGEEGAP